MRPSSCLSREIQSIFHTSTPQNPLPFLSRPLLSPGGYWAAGFSLAPGPLLYQSAWLLGFNFSKWVVYVFSSLSQRKAQELTEEVRKTLSSVPAVAQKAWEPDPSVEHRGRLGTPGQQILLLPWGQEGTCCRGRRWVIGLQYPCGGEQNRRLGRWPEPEDGCF